MLLGALMIRRTREPNDMRTRTPIVALCVALLAMACVPAEPGTPPADGARPPEPDSSAPVVDASDPEIPDSATPDCPEPGQVAMNELCNAFDDDCDGVVDEGVCDDPCDVFDAP